MLCAFIRIHINYVSVILTVIFKRHLAFCEAKFPRFQRIFKKQKRNGSPKTIGVVLCQDNGQFFREKSCRC